LKKFLISILIVVALVYLSGKFYNIYHDNNLLETETVVNIYPNLPDHKVDEFFNLPKGTFDSKKHQILYSFVKSDGYLLDYYLNLPIYNYQNRNNINCEESYSNEKHSRISRNEIVDDGMLYVRLSSDLRAGTSKAKSQSNLAIKTLPISFTFGKINSVIVNEKGTIRYCP